ncbi:MAG: hypothetical protein VX988_03075 [Planctomycetota bacterium]|nr:hypothetical protein [Planctomycetota bacterium]
MDFTVGRCTRRCSKTERELQPDEPFYSVLACEGVEVVRHDFCEQAWDGPPKDVLGWWKSQMPGKQTNRYNLAPNEILLHYFEELDQQPEKADVRYVMALLLIRRRVARLEESERTDDGSEQLALFCPRNEKNYSVRIAQVSAERRNEIQEELASLLFADAS